MPRKSDKAPATKESSKHLDSDRKETKAGGEKKHNSGTLLDGIVGGLPRKINPPVVDGVVRGCRADLSPSLGGQMSSVTPSATGKSRGDFGAGIFPQGA